MTVEAGAGTMGEERDEFPVGMRVLAVDDDPTCLKVLDAMLRQCKYHVTTTNQAIKALKMLRENKDKFDLIITDVHMPDMDGFKLLELVGLEMDLPVIMLSANGDTKAVMKGITHGACDYLLKPVRMEELKNIWQHVLRKKKSVSREHNNSDNGTGEVGHGPNTSGSSENKLNRKRKDQNEEEEDDSEENANENENTSTQKRARVVWSVELHRKFMAAVNHLGINKAVPKKILDLMNVEGLTRENVASHLQKYRLYLKKVASQEANLAATFGVRDTYLPFATRDGFGDFHSLTPSNQLPALQSFQQSGGRSRKDSSLFGQNIAHGMVQVGHTENVRNPVNDVTRFQRVTGSHRGNLIQSMPTTVDQLQPQKKIIQEANNCFPVNFLSTGLGAGCSNNPTSVIANSPLAMLSHSSIGLTPVCSAPFEANAEVSSNFSDPVKCNENLQSAILSTGTASGGLAMSSSGFPVVSQMPLNFSSSTAPVTSLCYPVTANTMFMMDGNEDSKFFNFGSAENTRQQLRETKQEHTHEPNIIFGSLIDPPLAGQSIIEPSSHGQRFNDVMNGKRAVVNMNGQTNYGCLFVPQQCKIDKSILDGQLKYKDTYSLQSSTMQGMLGSHSYSDNELMNVIKSKREDALFMDG